MTEIHHLQEDEKTNRWLKEIEIFGYGKFDIKLAGKTKIILSNKNNPFSKDYFQKVGKNKETVDNFICLILEKIYELNGIKVKVNELSCMAKCDPECIFEINFVS